ncbi:MAG: hypothetical protein FWE73_07525 [Candidatus Bathyarchaeota archaeon]|nr:hypothetical protein [Candidatus Termitimicrobium sp.]
MSQHNTGSCGCYEKTKKCTPANLFNPPGLSTLKYRVGTHSQFKTDMVEAISHKPALKNLTTRENADLGIALLDSWATIADVLTFYQERIVNEGYLRTATERRSVLELARAIGYELRPGVAASVPLVFMVENTEGAPQQSRVDEGTKIMSIPGQDETMQIFETIETIEAKAALNDLRPLQFAPKKITHVTTELYLKGVNTHLVPGDAILIAESDWLEKDDTICPIDDEGWAFRFIHTVTVHPDKNYTHITWKKGLGKIRKSNEIGPLKNPAVFVFKQRASFFGYNAPDWQAMPDTVKESYENGSDWPEFDEIFDTADFAVNDDKDIPIVTVHLDAVYPKILSKSWVVFVGQQENKTDKQTQFCVSLGRVLGVEVDAQCNFTLNAKTTKLELDMTEKNIEGFLRRSTAVFCVSEPLGMINPPFGCSVSKNGIVLDRKVPELKKGQKIIIQGKLANDLEAPSLVSEIAVIKDCEVVTIKDGEVSAIKDLYKKSATVSSEGGVVSFDETGSEIEFEITKIILENELLHYDYDLDSVHIYANVAFATHGETVYETLGSGDSLATNQQFRLKKPPLTYVSAAAPSGVKSTLKVYINDVQWQEVLTLYGLGPKDLDYFVRVEDNGATLVSFGDGLSGARLPSGAENITVSYRSGIGLQGTVAANKLTLLTKKPFGIRSVTNPIAASGAASPEKMIDAKINAPSTVLTLGRIVSLKDYENFARTFLGIAKARAIAEEDGTDYIVRLTVAPVDAQYLSSESLLYINLKETIEAICAYGQKVRLVSFISVYFKVVGTVYVDLGYRPEEVEANIKVALINAFSFEKRSLNQAVTSEEILAVIQAVPGVIYFNNATEGNSFFVQSVTPSGVLVEVVVDKYILGVDELLMIDPDGIDLAVEA